jgi:hypothetical protein
MAFEHYIVGTTVRGQLVHVVIRYSKGVAGGLHMFCNHERVFREKVSEYDWHITCLWCLGATGHGP